jgi:AP-4 complex subunit epsilon-1
LRLLEGADVLCQSDGEVYAKHVQEALALIEGSEGATSVSTLPVLELVVERVLVKIRDADEPFRIGCVTTIIAFAGDENSTPAAGPTLLVIVAALATQYGQAVSSPPSGIILGLSKALTRVSRECF